MEIKTLAQKLATQSVFEDQQYCQLQETCEKGGILDLHPRPTESESELLHHPRVMHMHMKI